jgi:ferritin-like metal-binding protein YciE
MPPNDIHEQLTKYLTDAHSIEVQAIAQLESAPKIAGEPTLAEALRTHLAETEAHERRTRELLEQRGASPSRLKDMVMGIGGKGFVLFAKLMPDTPGKLLAHAISYEALETASYELLARTAALAEEGDVERAAREICDEERRMMGRLEGCYDAAVEASLRAVGNDDLQEQLRKYLADAHAIEEQAIGLLERAPDLSGDTRLNQLYEEHLSETREHAELVQARLRELGGSTNALKDAALKLGALNWGGFFAGHPDTPGKLCAFSYAFEHLEIAGYEELKRVARRANDEKTAQLAERILNEERTAAERLSGMFDDAVDAALEAQGISMTR